MPFGNEGLRLSSTTTWSSSALGWQNNSACYGLWSDHSLIHVSAHGTIVRIRRHRPNRFLKYQSFDHMTQTQTSSHHRTSHNLHHSRIQKYPSTSSLAPKIKINFSTQQTAGVTSKPASPSHAGEACGKAFIPENSHPHPSRNPPCPPPFLCKAQIRNAFFPTPPGPG